MPQLSSLRANVLASSAVAQPKPSLVPATLSGRTRIRIPMMQDVEGGSTVNMPALSSTMTEGKISQWLKGIGDKVEAGDMLLVVESDKADMDVVGSSRSSTRASQAPAASRSTGTAAS